MENGTVSPTLETGTEVALLEEEKPIKIRRLTPKECFRLQGWDYKANGDEYFERAAFVNSDSQLYKQAGNGVTVNVIFAIASLLCDDCQFRIDTECPNDRL